MRRQCAGNGNLLHPNAQTPAGAKRIETPHVRYAYRPSGRIMVVTRNAIEKIGEECRTVDCAEHGERPRDARVG